MYFDGLIKISTNVTSFHGHDITFIPLHNLICKDASNFKYCYKIWSTVRKPDLGFDLVHGIDRGLLRSLIFIYQNDFILFI